MDCPINTMEHFTIQFTPGKRLTPPAVLRFSVKHMRIQTNDLREKYHLIYYPKEKGINSWIF